MRLYTENGSHFLTSNEVTSRAAVQTGAGATRAAGLVVLCDPIHVTHIYNQPLRSFLNNATP